MRRQDADETRHDSDRGDARRVATGRVLTDEDITAWTREAVAWAPPVAPLALTVPCLVRWYPIRYHMCMDAAKTLRRARCRSGLSLRALAKRATTSHSALAAYEAGRKVPTVDTLDRIIRAAGFVLTTELTAGVGGPDTAARGRELVEVLELAGQFPARHAPTLRSPKFGRR